MSSAQSSVITIPRDGLAAEDIAERNASTVSLADRRTGNDNIPSLVQALASLLWLPQAALLATSAEMMVAGDLANIEWIIAGVIAVGILRALLDAFGTRLAFRNARRRLSEKRREAILALARRSPLDMDKPASGLAASVIAEQAEAVLPYLARYRPARMKATIVPVGILICIFPLSWVAGLVLLISAPLIPVFMALIGWRAKAASEKHLAEMGGLNAFLLDRLRGLATIRSLGAVDHVAQRLRANANELRIRTMAVLRIAFLSSAVLELFAALGVAMVAVYVGFHFLGQLEFGAWGYRLSLGEGLFILLLAPAFFEPLRELSAVWHDRAAGEAAIEALDQLSITGIEMSGGEMEPHRSDQSVGAASVEIKDLTFSHAGSQLPLLDGFNLEVQAGERVALLGASGSGKSTILALIAGLAPCQSGSIRIGQSLLDENSSELIRKRLAWIGQKPHIFSGTVSDNICLRRADMDDEDINAALQTSRLHNVSNAKGHNYLGEGGAGLSGGEVRRLALARAAIKSDADIILADEPTAHLDMVTANEISDSLLAMSAGKTLIVATHDPILARRMDRIIVVGGAGSEGEI
ncbi:thiol reductant ABC exporter subunit CydD [Phyllobacterium sp. YR531]|uniref:thiol reductant ABC exporter subunit CydD n=1 Tax=Phyllobacterium sp. YR531 TaxID=1144343 RepID=UPI00026FB2AA|nr:thiol reductant ABC exporter subunit CydD [Phyllobacterium sp. YR531]EJN00453.1 cysteine export CydDC family ABC transporter permease subunit/ATP-binding protein CydD [Phyllobacterium sp. YR531]